MTGTSRPEDRLGPVGASQSRRVKNGPLACVLGDMDLVRPLARAGIPCAVLAEGDTPTRYSRFARHVIEAPDPFDDSVIDRLIDFASAMASAPVLFYQYDRHLLLVSRHRARLALAFRFVIAPEDLVEALLDKVRFHALAQRLALPTPRTVIVDPAETLAPPRLELAFPVILKPMMRGPRWPAVARSAKAIRLDTAAQLDRLWPVLSELAEPVLVQELVPGPEDRVESYHVYVAGDGELVAEFTGRKIRTVPAEYGHTTSLRITRDPELMELGRWVVASVGLTGVAKLDFKRAPDGNLRLLEVNPRFNLWHHAGAAAGVNIPALVWADLSGRPRDAAVQRAKAGVRWVNRGDAAAARRAGISGWRWLLWALRSDTKSVFAWDDPRPAIARLAHWLRRHRRSAERRTGELAAEL